MSNDNKNLEVAATRSQIAGYFKPVDVLTAEDLLAEIALNETIEYCETSRMGGTAQHRCMQNEQTRFQKDPKAFVADFLRSKNDWKQAIYKKMSEKYLYADPFQIQQNLRWCLDLVSASEYLKLSIHDLSSLLESTQCVARTETTQKTKDQERDNAMQRSEELWQAAETMREASRGWGAGDPDDIQAIMDRYADYRYYQGSADDFKNAQVRSQKAGEMMENIGRDRGGWPQFKKKFCGEPEVIERKTCSYEGDRAKYRLSCEFGITKEYESGHCSRPVL